MEGLESSSFFFQQREGQGGVPYRSSSIQFDPSFPVRVRLAEPTTQCILCSSPAVSHRVFFVKDRCPGRRLLSGVVYGGTVRPMCYSVAFVLGISCGLRVNIHVSGMVGGFACTLIKYSAGDDAEMLFERKCPRKYEPELVCAVVRMKRRQLAWSRSKSWPAGPSNTRIRPWSSNRGCIHPLAAKISRRMDAAGKMIWLV